MKQYILLFILLFTGIGGSLAMTVVGKRLTRAVTRNTQLRWGDLG